MTTGKAKALLLCAVALVAAARADVACSFEGATMNVVAPSTHVGSRLVLLWDAADKGDDPSAWANAHEIAAAVPAVGARYSIDLASLGITNGTPCRIATLTRYRLLDMLQMNSRQCYIDTGFKDTEVYGVRFGFYGTSGAAGSWDYVMGSKEGTDAARGFVVGANNANYGSWFWTYTGYRSGTRPAVSTTSINEAVFGSRRFVLNGNAVKSDLADGSVGVTGVNIFLGRSQDMPARVHYGWWSHVSFDDADGNRILDYIPARRGDGAVGFWDRATDKFVTSMGGGAFNAGTVTNEGFEVVSSIQRVAPNHVIGLEVKGSKLYATAPAGLAEMTLTLVWGDGDRGNEVDAWANSHELAAGVDANGGVYVADLARLGVRNGQTCRVVARHSLQLLDMLKMSSRSEYVDTGVKDSQCYGVRFGFYGNESQGDNNNTFQLFIGTVESVGTTGGFGIGMNNARYDSWYWIYRKYKSDNERPTVSTNSINDVTFADQTFTVNGTVKKTGLEAGPVGESGKNMHLGTFASRTRFLFGWWSYVRFDDADGNAILDYVPARRIADGTVGFYDRATGRFVTSTGGGAFTAGTVTNDAWTAVNSGVAIVPQTILALDVSFDGAVALSATAPPACAGERLLLLWDDADKGDDVAAWAHTHVLAEAIPAQGGAYSANLAALGVGREHVCRVVTVNQMQLLDKLEMTSKAYFDTGIADSACYGVSFGFYGTEYTAGFANMIGTAEDGGGFAVGLDNLTVDQWYWYYRDAKYTPRPKVRTDAINDVAFGWRAFVLNGTAVRSDLPAGAVGTSGLTMRLGTWQGSSRFLYGWWSYARFDDAAGNAIIDYIPATRASDGKIGFLDRATGAFVDDAHGGTLTAGTVTNDSFAVTHLAQAVSLADVVATATWSGAGALDDPASWACTNLYGEEVAGLPGAYTAVTIPSADAFSCPAGTSFACRSLAVGGALTADRDWRGLDFAKVSGAIDLAGHALHVRVGADMLQATTVTDTVGGGALHVEVPVGLAMTNPAVAFTGELKLVKEGAGAFTAAKAGQTYSGGTDVAAGTFACGGTGASGVYGAADATNTVFAGAIFNCGGFGGNDRAVFVLAGGTLAEPQEVADVTLAADSFIRATSIEKALARGDLSEATLEMGGHTLTVDIADGGTLGLLNLTVTGGGTIMQRNGGFLQFGSATAKGVNAPGTVLHVLHSLRVRAASTFRDYIADYQGNWDDGPTQPIKVVGRFCPTAADVEWHSVELQDGATLDLSRIDGVWNATCTGSGFEGPSVLSFVSGATVTVDMGDRAPQLDDQLVAWTERPQNVTFVWDFQLPLCALKSGLFVKTDPGMAIIFR